MRGMGGWNEGRQRHSCVVASGSYESLPVRVDKCFERRPKPTTNRFDQVVRSGEDPVLMINDDFTQMLDDKGVSTRLRRRFEFAIQCARVMSGRWFLSARCHQVQHRVNAHLLVLDVSL